MRKPKNNKSIGERGIKSLAARVERLERAQFESFKRDVLAGVAQFERGGFEPFDATVYEKVIGRSDGGKRATKPSMSRYYETRLAKQDLLDVLRFIVRDDTDAASRFLYDLRNRYQQLADHNEMGRK